MAASCSNGGGETSSAPNVAAHTQAKDIAGALAVIRREVSQHVRNRTYK